MIDVYRNSQIGRCFHAYRSQLHGDIVLLLLLSTYSLSTYLKHVRLMNVRRLGTFLTAADCSKSRLNHLQDFVVYKGNKE